MKNKIINAIVMGLALLMFITFSYAFLVYYFPSPDSVQIINESVNQPLVIWTSLIGSAVFLHKTLYTILNPTSK